MKVNNLDLQPNRTFRFRKLELDDRTAMRALVHQKTEEAILVTESAVKYHPATIELDTWQQLLDLADLEEETPKTVSPWAWITGDNPFLVVTSAGNPFPFGEGPENQVDYDEALRLYTEATQAALHSRGIAAAISQSFGLAIQGIMAGICVVGAIITAAVLIPKILETW